MIFDAFHEVFLVVKFFFGLGALGGLLGIGVIFLWFSVRIFLGSYSSREGSQKNQAIRKVFFEV